MNNNKNIDPCEEIDRLAKIFLNIYSWGFQEDVRINQTKFPQVIYNSEWCRVKFSWGGWEMTGRYTINIHYGRLHAPDSEYMIWNGEKCYCWHDIDHILYILDGYSADTLIKNKVGWPRIMEEFRQSELGKSLRYQQPEWLTRMHAAIWEQYRDRLFEVFDLRRPDLWENYRQFMKDLYDIKGRSPNIKPSLDNVC